VALESHPERVHHHAHTPGVRSDPTLEGVPSGATWLISPHAAGWRKSVATAVAAGLARKAHPDGRAAGPPTGVRALRRPDGNLARQAPAARTVSSRGCSERHTRFAEGETALQHGSGLGRTPDRVWPRLDSDRDGARAGTGQPESASGRPRNEPGSGRPPHGAGFGQGRSAGPRPRFGADKVRWRTDACRTSHSCEERSIERLLLVCSHDGDVGRRGSVRRSTPTPSGGGSSSDDEARQTPRRSRPRVKATQALGPVTP